MFVGSGDAIHIGEQTLNVVGNLQPTADSLSGISKYLAGGLGLLGLGGLFQTSSRKLRETEQRLAQETRLRRELAAYLTLDLSPRTMPRNEFARLLSRTIATRSSFARAAVLLCDTDGALSVAGSAGMDDLSVQSLNRWAADAAASLGAEDAATDGEPIERVGSCSFAVQLERRTTRAEDRMAALGCARVHVTPMRTSKGLLGAIVVCATPRPALRATSAASLRLFLEPIEALALCLTTQLTQERVTVLPAVHGEAFQARAQERGKERQARSGRRRSDHTGAAPAWGDHGKVATRQFLEIARRDKATGTQSPSNVVTGFPSAKHWHNSSRSSELAVMPAKSV